MSREKDFFNAQAASLRVLTEIYEYERQAERFSGSETDHLLRSEFVLLVSAFDNYLHNIVRRIITESFFSADSAREKLDFEKLDLELQIKDIRAVINEEDPNVRNGLFDAALRRHLAESSFQSPRSVEYALGLVQVRRLWKTASDTMGDTPENIRIQLAQIAQRRNQIVHESDYNVSTSEARPIDTETVSDCRDFLTRLVACIDTLIAEQI